MTKEQRIQSLMCRVSKAIYNNFKEVKYGITPCCDKMTRTEIREALLDIELLKYLSKSKDKCCDTEKLIEKLT